MKIRFPQSSKYLVLFSLVVVCGRSQDFYWNTASARSAAMGGVYTPSSSGAIDAMAANPAGLTMIGAPTLDLSLAGIFARGSFTNSVNQNSALQDQPGALPFGAFATPLGHSRFSFGVGVTPELASVSNWRYVDAPGVAGASYGLQQQKSAIVAGRLGAGVGYTVNKYLSLGLSLGVVYNTNTLDAPYIFQTNPALAGLKTALSLHTSGFGWNGSVGAIVHPSKRMTLNAAWKSRTVVNSTGTARGDLYAQFAALGLAAPSSFTYSAAVQNVLPQSIIAGVDMRVKSGWVIAFQGDWVNWNNAFVGLPVALTNGSNSAINGLLGSNAISDRVPLLWKDQYTIRGGVERTLTENVSVRAGYAHSTDPIPSSTLSPLTAAIMKDTVSAGFAYRYGRWRFDFAYGITPEAKQSVGKSALEAGEYSNSTVHLGTQMLTLNTAYRF